MHKLFSINILTYRLSSGTNALIAQINEHIQGLDPTEHFNLFKKRKNNERKKKNLEEKKIKKMNN